MRLRWFSSSWTAALLLWGLDLATATSKSTSLDEPFQDAFNNLPHAPCVTLYHRNGRVGCGTLDREIQKGPLVYFDGSSQISGNAKFVAVVEEFDFTKDNIATLLKSNQYGNLKGVLVLNSKDSEDVNDYFSPSYQYPLGYGTPSANLGYGNIQYPWNSNGDGLIGYDLYGVPIAYVLDEDTSNAIRDVAKDSSKAPRFLAQFNYYMGPDNVNTAKCLAWRDEADDEWNPKCLPLGGTSVWAHAGSPPMNRQGRRNLDGQEDENGQQQAYQADGRPSILLGTSTDTTSMFHDVAPGANTAASNTLTLLMAAYLIGQSVDDATLDALPKRILFGFFTGESFGYIGSRNFLKDVLEFQCADGLEVPSVSKDENSDPACLYPLRPSLKFQEIGEIAGMISVDQVGFPLSEGVLYVHNSGNGGMGTFLANALKYSKTKTYSVASSEANGNNNDNGYPYPPTPLTSLMSLTEGAVDGAVLTGYDYIFPKRPPYQSHLNSVDNISMNLKSIASAATIMARAALAAAYDDGSGDYEEAAEYAAGVISALSYKNELLVELSECFWENGDCSLLRKYAKMEAANENARTGFNVQVGESLGQPPNYYTGIYNMFYGQPFVQVGDQLYGNYNGEKYGERKSDAVGLQPRLLPQALRNMLTDFLGKGSLVDGNGNAVNARSCSKASDCVDVSYCSAYGDVATCTGSKICACSRAHYHPALDEALTPSLEKGPGYFEVDANDAGISPMYSEPFWSSDVGVSLYRNSNSTGGWVSLAAGFVMLVLSFFATVGAKMTMKKQKLY